MPCGVFKTTYAEDMAFIKWPIHRVALASALVFLAVYPFVFRNDIYMLYWANYIAIFLIATLGINILTGYAGQISLGHGAFMAVGAYTSTITAIKLGLPFPVTIFVGALTAMLFGLLFGVPSLRLKGFYLAIATLAAQYLVDFLLVNPKLAWLTGGSAGLVVPEASILGFTITKVPESDFYYYFVSVPLAVFFFVFAANLTRSDVGRAWVAIRDNDIAAEIMGINVFKYKLLAFAIASFYAGVAGALWAYYVGYLTPEHYTIALSIDFVAMILIGGLGRHWGSLIGTVFVLSLPELLKRAIIPAISGFMPVTFTAESLRPIIFGATIILFLIAEPHGIVELLRKIKEYLRLFPFPY
ncbi:branched-chain amino acid ABC transporter permease [Archaeoglobus veneficus]|uniref:ABC-type transporter, integral membrane subunit n=1 Tax=Archaeoglobus veneficus (strain DSM 11195 / SNP6) TaxID=693661 RepID=F2KSX4_ARCVS|nr:branched-chain amino acid ABC transporter permease [Archaeoglobus veneficus]AEA47019.1 ABC-type transporter, integral membrane subunit [Archaeoglobus veneficus SNP6]